VHCGEIAKVHGCFCTPKSAHFGLQNKEHFQAFFHLYTCTQCEGPILPGDAKSLGPCLFFLLVVLMLARALREKSAPSAASTLALVLLVNYCQQSFQVRLIEDEGGQNPDVDVDGFVLRSLYMYGAKGGENHDMILRRSLKFSEHPHLSTIETLNTRRKLLQMPELGTILNTRAQILALAKLNFLQYPGTPDEIRMGYYDSDVVDTLYKAGIWIFSSNLTSEVNEIMAMQKIIEAEVTKTSGGSWA
jgi:hypothetical protein